MNSLIEYTIIKYEKRMGRQKTGERRRFVGRRIFLFPIRFAAGQALKRKESGLRVKSGFRSIIYNRDPT